VAFQDRIFGSQGKREIARRLERVVKARSKLGKMPDSRVGTEPETDCLIVMFAKPEVADGIQALTDICRPRYNSLVVTRFAGDQRLEGPAAIGVTSFRYLGS